MQAQMQAQAHQHIGSEASTRRHTGTEAKRHTDTQKQTYKAHTNERDSGHRDRGRAERRQRHRSMYSIMNSAAQTQTRTQNFCAVK
eukprot:807572-Pleurochrysis_carterae.AAC.2